MENHFNPGEKRWSEKLDIFFEKIAVLRMDHEQKGRVAVHIKEQSGHDRLYWNTLFLSALIGALGLIQGQVAVVIGAMLIAPFLGPIQGFAFAITNGEHKIFFQSFRTLVFSIIITISIGFLSAFVIGYFDHNTEILSRTQSNILDLLIALASGVLAFLSLRFTRLHASIAGVAMASALLPPLLVVGIEISLSNFFLATQAFFLFFANLIAILAAGIVMLFLFGYSAHVNRQLKTLKNASIVFLIFIIILVPLAGSFVAATERNRLRSVARDYLDEALRQHISSYTITHFDVFSGVGDHAILQADILVPEGVSVFSEIHNSIENNIGERLQRPIDLRMYLTRSVSLVSRSVSESPHKLSREQEYTHVLQQTWTQILSRHGLTVEQVDVTYIGVDIGAFDPKNIEKIDFFIRARGKVSENTYTLLQDQLYQNALSVFPFPSHITLEIMPIHSYSITLDYDRDTR